jgi:hypothetical protein
MLSMEHFRDLSGRRVVGRDGSSLGEIDQLYADRDGGQPTFATVRTGATASQVHFAPLDGARMEGEVVTLAYDAETVRSAPAVASGGDLSEEEESRLYKHYGMNTPATAGTITEEEIDLGHPAGMAGAENPAAPTDHPTGMAGLEGAPSWPAHHEQGMAGQAEDPYPAEHPLGMAGKVTLPGSRLRRWTGEPWETGRKATTGERTAKGLRRQS